MYTNTLGSGGDGSLTGMIGVSNDFNLKQVSGVKLFGLCFN